MEIIRFVEEELDHYEATDITQEHLELLAGALQVEGALPYLRTLYVNYTFSYDNAHFSTLVRVLAGGIAPSLEKFYFNEAGFNEDDYSSLADMVEARARIPECKGLERIDGNGDDWFDEASLKTRIRLLRALLPSVKALPPLGWEDALEACFIETKSPCEALDVYFAEDMNASPLRMFQAAPALKKIVVVFDIPRR